MLTIGTDSMLTADACLSLPTRLGKESGCHRNLRLRVPSLKFAPRFIGPFCILLRINPVAYVLYLPPSMRISNVFHISLLKPLVCTRSTTSVPRPHPIQVENHEEYEVQSIVDSRRFHGCIQYLVHWKGYSLEERCWVSPSDVHAPVLLCDFHRHFPLKQWSAEGEGSLRRGHCQGWAQPFSELAAQLSANCLPAPSLCKEGLCWGP
uniref:Chromobox protein homolog 5 n=1 Tax=Aquarana catesbeiana TaxID=8400 RepID=C1C4Q8_AQUCT|nr:Chromobox protein homolog 5 [Aquarana catesbeiana]